MGESVRQECYPSFAAIVGPQSFRSAKSLFHNLPCYPAYADIRYTNTRGYNYIHLLDSSS